MYRVSSFLLISIVVDITCLIGVALATHTPVPVALTIMLVRCCTLYLCVAGLLLIAQRKFGRYSFALFAWVSLLSYLVIPLLIHALKPGQHTLADIIQSTHTNSTMFSFIYLPYILGASAGLLVLSRLNKSLQQLPTI